MRFSRGPSGFTFKLRQFTEVAVLGLAFVVTGPRSAEGADAKPRVVVLGFDGADHRLVARYIEEGKLPNLKSLADTGGLRPLRPTIPAQTPVSWSTFSTGLSPGKTQIFDFLKRDPATYRPGFAVAEEGRRKLLFGSANRYAAAAAAALLAFVVVLPLARFLLKSKPWTFALGGAFALALVAGFFGYRVGRLLPEALPTVTNNRRGMPFWEAAAKQGVKSVVMHVPVTFPAVDYENGRLISGLGVPDVRGRVGTPSFYTSDPFFAPRNKNEFSVELVRLENNTGTIQTEVFGPYNKLFPEPPVIKIPMALTVLPDRQRLRIEPQGSEAITLAAGEWSGWVRFTFPFNSLVKLHGIGRFHVASVSPEIKLYLSPIHFDPEDLPPAVKITAPGSLAKELAHEHGLFKTMGWQIDTWSMSEGVIDEETFLDDVSFTVAQSKKMMASFLSEKDVTLFVQVYEFTDRVAHCFTRFTDTEHPAYDAEKAGRYGIAIERSYQQMDAIVGEAMKVLGKDDVLIVLSDHGFSSWRRSVNYNTWLVENGYMTLTGQGKEADLEMLFGQGEFWPNVDWSKTKAYAMGLGEIYINVKGREGKGSVAPGAEYEAVRQELIERLGNLTDPANGRRAVAHVYTREQAYGSFDANLIPDLFVTNTEGYRVSWQASLGVVTKELFEDNRGIWSGDHCSLDPDVVPGILLSNRKLPPDRTPGIADVPATILKVLGVPPPEKLDGEPLFQ
ncbi:MAG: alkaline phosphatase family protein [Acidobacteria bacterium]|nr:alkaline phosphatase family protein [Acidobacteriota bacterium]